MNARGSLLLIFVLLCGLPAVPQTFTAQCLFVIDGDTMEVSKDGGRIRIRLEGIDCPEKEEPFVQEAKAFATRMAAGKTVTVIEKEQDPYGRTVARVCLDDGRDLSVELLKAGLARYYGRFNSDWLLARLEQDAKAAGVGMWGAPGTSSGSAENRSIVYHGNTGSRVFHAPSCPDYNCKRCTRVFQSRAEAVAAGFRPCGRCRP